MFTFFANRSFTQIAPNRRMCVCLKTLFVLMFPRFVRCSQVCIDLLSKMDWPIEIHYFFTSIVSIARSKRAAEKHFSCANKYVARVLKHLIDL